MTDMVWTRKWFLADTARLGQAGQHSHRGARELLPAFEGLPNTVPGRQAMRVGGHHSPPHIVYRLKQCPSLQWHFLCYLFLQHISYLKGCNVQQLHYSERCWTSQENRQASCRTDGGSCPSHNANAVSRAPVIG